MNHRFRYGRDHLALGLKKNASERKSLLSEGVFASNIDLSTPGSLRVSLWNEWRAMLDDLRKIGPVWHMTRNGLSVIASQGEYPELTFSANHQSAHACRGDSALFCHFDAWKQASAFESACCCGPTYGLEIQNTHGHIFHRICLAKGTSVTPFVEWTQVHQATGLELPDDIPPPTSIEATPCPPGTLEVDATRLRTVLITAAQHEIPLVAAVSSVGMTQTAHLTIERAVENHGWLVLSNTRRSLYVEAEPPGILRVERRSLQGEPVWTLSLFHPDGLGLLRLQTDIDHGSAWNRLVQETLL